jgi:hypothetical protein
VIAEVLPDTTPAAPPPAAPEAAADAPAGAPSAETAEGTPDPSLPPVIVTDAPEPPQGIADAPRPGFRGAAGVKVNRLPRIGEAVPAPEETLPPDLPVLDPDRGGAIARHAAAFDNPDKLPLLSILLVDLGEEAGGLDAATVATIAAPVTIAIDPTRPDAADRARTYRAAGFEVAILAESLPPRATAADLEVLYQAYRAALPEAVALLGRSDAPFQTNRAAAEHVVQMLAPDGLALVTYARGLNPTTQFATEAALPHAEIFRVVDADGAGSETVRRALDRAAFEAVQSGRVTVLASSRPESVTALFAWAAEGDKGVAVAPVSAAAAAAVAPAEAAGGSAEAMPAPVTP